MKLDYCIVAPKYRHNSAGIKTLYILCQKLIDRGFRARMIAEPAITHDPRIEFVPQTTCMEIMRHLYNPIVVYPEVVNNNRVGAKNAVWWYLNEPSFWKMNMTIPEGSLIFKFSKVQVKGNDNPKHVLFIPCVERELFNPFGRVEPEGEKRCWYKGVKSDCIKGWKEDVWEKTKDLVKGTEINLTYPATREELAKILKSHNLFISWDGWTALYHESALCGCPAVIIPDGVHKRDDYENSEMAMNGVAYGMEELPRAIATLKDAQTHYEELLKETDKQLDRFISITQSHFQRR